MARGRSRQSGEYGEFWPGYVDVLSTLLLVVTFLMSLFMIAQYFAAQEASGKDTALKRLTRQISELTELLAREGQGARTTPDELAALQATLVGTARRERQADRRGPRRRREAPRRPKGAWLVRLTADLEAQKNVSNEALAKVDLLNQQLLALRRQIAALERCARGCRRRRAPESDKTHQGSRRSGSTPRSPAGAGAASAIARTSSAACVTSCKIARTSASSATVSFSNPRCCFRPARQR